MLTDAVIVHSNVSDPVMCLFRKAKDLTTQGDLSTLRVQRSVFGGWRRTSEAALEASQFLPCPGQEYVDVARQSGSAGAPASPGGSPVAAVRPTLEPTLQVDLRTFAVILVAIINASFSFASSF